MSKKLFRRFFRDNAPLSVVLIAVGSIVWSLTMVKSGLIYSYGMGFWGPNGHDGVWHISLIQSLARGSWQIPVFAGEAIKNYHIGFDLLVSWLYRLTFIPIHNLYFQILPPIFAFLIGYFAYKFVYVWRKSQMQAFWATFFVYFGGSWGWAVTGIRNKELGGESLFWSQQSISTLINPPFALSILLIFAGLWMLIKGLRTKDKKLLTIATFIFGILIQIKVYAGILVLVGLITSGFWRILKRQGVSLIKVAIGAVIVSILLFSPVSRSVEKAIIFKPFWFLEQMMASPDRFYWPKYAEAMVNYKLAENILKGIPAYLIAFFIFWLGNLGTRVIKVVLVFRWLKNWRKVTYLEVFFVVVIVVGILFPLFFVQSGTPWNTIQFMYYSLMFSGVLAGVALGEWIEKQHRGANRFIASGLVILLTVPTTVGTLKHYLPSRPPAKISNEELEALEFLIEQPDGVVLTLPFDHDAAQAAANNPPRPLYLYESTAYVSAFSGKPVYLEDEVNLEITGYGWRGRRLKEEGFFDNSIKYFLLDNKISYIYVTKNESTFESENVGLEKIFENQEVTVFKVI